VLVACYGALAILSSAAPSTRARAQTIDMPSTVRRLPPLTSGMSAPSTAARSLPRTTPSGPASEPSSVDAMRALPRQRDHAALDREYVQQTSAIGAAAPASAGDGLRVRRLPPLADPLAGSLRRADRPASPAHITAEPAGSRPATGASRVLPGSFTIARRAVYLGAPPQPAVTPGDLGDVGRSTLRPPGQLPRSVASPITLPVAR